MLSYTFQSTYMKRVNSDKCISTSDNLRGPLQKNLELTGTGIFTNKDYRRI